MKKKFILSSLLMLFALVLSSCQEQRIRYEIYSIGTEIAEGVGTSLAVGFSLMDSDLTYEIKTSNDEFTLEENTWPIIDVSVIVKSEVLSSPKITFVLLLEVDHSSGTVVGTVKNIKADGLANPSLDLMNNTMYIETNEGTEQVQIIEGELRKTFPGGLINDETPVINDTDNTGAEPFKDNLSENEDFSDFIYNFSNIIVQNTTKDFNLIFDDSLKVYHNSVNIKLKSIMEGVENYFLKWTVLKDSIVSVSQSSQNSYRYNYNKFYEIARKSDGKHFQYEIAGFYEINPISGRIYKLKDETTRKVNSFYDVDIKKHFLYSINDPDGYSNLRSSPYGEIIKKVYETETFNVTDTIDKHCKVIFPDGTEGYIHVSRVIQRTHPT